MKPVNYDEEEKMTKKELALQRFEEGFRGGQSVVEAFAGDYGLDAEMAQRIATPFTGGSSLKGNCCAVSGAFIILGFEYGVNNPDDLDAYEFMFSKLGEFVDEFKNRHGELKCHRLLDLDVFSEAGYKEFREKDMHHTHCTKYVSDTVSILENILRT